jgi:hypothetical protein
MPAVPPFVDLVRCATKLLHAYLGYRDQGETRIKKRVAVKEEGFILKDYIYLFTNS